MDDFDDLPELHPDDEVTQYGRLYDSGPNFRCRPRNEESGLSLIWGSVSTETACSLICPFLKGRVRPSDSVRYSTIGTLEDAGFRVYRRPLDYFPHHLEVEFDSEWTDDVCDRFHKCFGEPAS